MTGRGLLSAALILLVVGWAGTAGLGFAQTEKVDYLTDVRPILSGYLLSVSWCGCVEPGGGRVGESLPDSPPPASEPAQRPVPFRSNGTDRRNGAAGGQTAERAATSGFPSPEAPGRRRRS